MSFPEISRRCLSCGAAVRAGARFCPQCGHPFEEESKAEAPQASAPPTAESARPSAAEAPKTKDWAPPTEEFKAFEQATAPEPAPVAVEPEPSSVSEPPSPEAEAEATDDAGEGVRAAALRDRVARVREGTRARVGRMREEAIVVLEEKPDDSGLRFVLAAAALFVGFLVLLFLSTFLR